MPKKKRLEKRKILICVLLVLWGITLGMQVAARVWDGFAQWYGMNVYPFFVVTIGRICSFVPFSVVELGLYGLILYVTYKIGNCIWITCKRQNEKKCWTKLFYWLTSVVSIGVFIFTLTCGINYFRKPFSEMSGFTIESHTEEELRALCVYLAEEINESSTKVQRDEQGITIMCENFHEEAIKAMENLAQQYPVLGGYYPNPKPVLVSEILTYQYIMGIYSPFTLEANYNKDMLDYQLPYSVCHELSHLKGFMREDEAGFIAYLACHYSGHPYFQYSGAMEAFSYAMGAYYNEAGYEKYCEVYELLSEEVIAERYAKDLWWKQYDTVIQDVSSQVNDAYLKANAQEDGIQSYGRMVELLLEVFEEGL